MKTIRLIGLLGLMACQMVSAKIGETRDQCAKRYDDPADATPKNIDTWYGRNGVIAMCRFRDDKCVGIMYSFKDFGVVTQPPDAEKIRFSKEQSMKLLGINAPGLKWVKVKADPYGADYDGIYETEDGKLHAKVSAYGVNVESVVYYKFLVGRTEQAAVDATIDSFAK